MEASCLLNKKPRPRVTSTRRKGSLPNWQIDSPVRKFRPSRRLRDPGAVRPPALQGRRDMVGRKIGCTSRALQQLFGIDTPDFGHLFADMLVSDGAMVDTKRLIAPMIEPEIAFVLTEGLSGPGLSGADVLAVTAEVVPALEVIDSRIAGWDIGFYDTVADNGSSARFVLGTPVTFQPRLDLASERVSLRRDGVEVDVADASACSGIPPMRSPG